MKKSVLIICTVLVTVAVLSTRLPAQAPPSNDVNAALIRELHDLRVAIEKLASANSRVQILASRGSQIEQRIGSLTDQLNVLNGKLTETSGQAALTNSKLEGVRQDLRTESDPEKRKILQDVQGGFMAQLEDIRYSQAALQAQAEAIRQQIIREQTNLSDIQRRLDDLDRSMSEPR